jgi:phosphoenolpyruvate-protein kinase (PTS system EI component)
MGASSIQTSGFHRRMGRGVIDDEHPVGVDLSRVSFREYEVVSVTQAAEVLARARAPGNDGRRMSADDKSRSEPASAVVEGIAVGLAVVWRGDPAPRSTAGSVEEEHARLASAVRRATRGVEELVRLLPRSEAELFEPELAMLEELGPVMLARVDAGVQAEDAVNEATSALPTDLLADARARLLDGLAHDRRTVEVLLEGRDGDRILVTETLTPSVVASLPGRVVGIIASVPEGVDERGTGHTSHAAILARGRVIPFVLVSREVIAAIANDDLVVIDAEVSPSSIWIAPTDSIVEAARARRKEWTRVRGDEETLVTAPLTHLGLEVHVNVGSLHEHIPTSADGVGLVRTELIFAQWECAPSEMEQFGVLRAIVARVGRGPVVVRLFDAGGDKPLPWLRAPQGSTSARGMELLFEHPPSSTRSSARSCARPRAPTCARFCHSSPAPATSSESAPSRWGSCRLAR